MSNAPRDGLNMGCIVSAGALTLSGLAVCIAVVALWLAYDRGVPGRGLSSYDYSTPQAALRSSRRMGANADVRAELELHRAGASSEAKRFQEFEDSIKFGDTFEYDGKVLILYRFKEEGIERYETQWFKKGEDGRYRHTYVPTYGWFNQGGEKARIAAAVSAWERRGYDADRLSLPTTLP